MVRCHNCDQKTDGDYCQWCHYPILRHRLFRRRNAKKHDGKKVAQLAKEQTDRKAAEAGNAKETEEGDRYVTRQVFEEFKAEVEELRRVLVEGLRCVLGEVGKEDDYVTRHELKEDLRSAIEEVRALKPTPEKTEETEKWVRKVAKETPRAVQSIDSQIYEGDI